MPDFPEERLWHRVKLLEEISAILAAVVDRYANEANWNARRPEVWQGGNNENGSEPGWTAAQAAMERIQEL